MGSKTNSIIGISKENFDQRIKEELFIVQSARLLPLLKPLGGEKALTSIFLSSIKLIKEFKEDIFKEANIKNGSKVFVCTEVTLKLNKNDTNKDKFDGLIIVVDRSNKIIDSAILEMKNKNNPIRKEQTENYIALADTFSINKLITISNQFVSKPSQFPIDVKRKNSVNLYHFSWAYVLTLGKILLYKNIHNINDEDQVEIMKEVLYYFENKESGVLIDCLDMGTDWHKVVESILSTSSCLNLEKNVLLRAVLSWHQEEQDLALKLSREMGQLVETESVQFNKDINKRFKNDIDSLCSTKSLTSIYKAINLTTPITLYAEMGTRIGVSVNITPSSSLKTSYAKIKWILDLINKCKNQNSEEYNKFEKNVNVELWIEVILKRASTSREANIDYLKDGEDIQKFVSKFGEKEIKEFKFVVRYINTRIFKESKNFINVLEDLVLNFYKVFLNDTSITKIITK